MKTSYLNNYVIFSIPFTVFLQEYDGKEDKYRWYRMKPNSQGEYKPQACANKPQLKDLRSWASAHKHTLAEAVAYFNAGGYFANAENPTSKTFRVTLCRSMAGRYLLQFADVTDSYYWYLTDLEGNTVSKYYIDGEAHSEWQTVKELGECTLPWGEGYDDLKHQKAFHQMLDKARREIGRTAGFPVMPSGV
jgi:hypothetical protein